MPDMVGAEGVVADDPVDVVIEMLSMYKPSSVDVSCVNCSFISNEVLLDRLIVLVVNVAKFEDETVQPPEVPCVSDGKVVLTPQSPSSSKPKSRAAGVLKPSLSTLSIHIKF